MTHHTGSDEGLSELLAEVLRAHHAEVSIEDGVTRSWRCSALDWASDVAYGNGSQFAAHVAAIQADALAARTAAPDALRERVEALAGRLEGFAATTIRADDAPLYAAIAAELRAALAERPDG